MLKKLSKNNFFLNLFANLVFISLWIIKSTSGKPYPIHWGFPPRTKTQYGYTLPDGYGEGGKSTLEWINRNKAKDAQ